MLAVVLSMASIMRRRGAKVWTAYYRDAKGIQHCRSTYLVDKKDAQKVAEAYENASREEQSLRKINRVLSEMRRAWRAASMLQSRCVRNTLSWLKEKKPEVAAATYTFYSQVSSGFPATPWRSRRPRHHFNLQDPAGRVSLALGGHGFVQYDAESSHGGGRDAVPGRPTR